jgi:hypothetical protein
MGIFSVIGNEKRLEQISWRRGKEMRMAGKLHKIIFPKRGNMIYLISLNMPSLQRDNFDIHI